MRHIGRTCLKSVSRKCCTFLFDSCHFLDMRSIIREVNLVAVRFSRFFLWHLITWLFLLWIAQRGRNKTRDQRTGPGTKFCQQNIAIKHACIELKFGSNVDYRLFFEMHISIFLHLPYFYYMQVKYRTMSWNTDPGPIFSVLTMSRNS